MYEDIKNTVYLVLPVNDSPKKVNKFFLLGTCPDGVKIADEQDDDVSYQSFLNLLQPQLGSVESGLIDETNWFFRIGASSGEEDDHKLMKGFPGENIFETCRVQLDKLRDLLTQLVDGYFNEFAEVLKEQEDEWVSGNWLPPGLLRLFLVGLAENWLVEGKNARPKSVAKAIEDGDIDGVTEWAQDYRQGEATSKVANDLLQRLENWVSVKKKEKSFLENVRSIQRLSQITGSRTLLKLLSFWPYQYILDRARQVWTSVADRNNKETLEKYRATGRYNAWDFLLATAWVNHTESLAEYKFSPEGGQKDFTEEQLKKLDGYRKEKENGVKPALAPKISREGYETRCHQTDSHIEGWRILFGCDDLSELKKNKDEVGKVKGLLECTKPKQWPEILKKAEEFHQLWGGIKALPAERVKALRKNSAETFARSAVEPSFEALFRSPAYGPHELPPGYLRQFTAMYAECLLSSDAENREALKDVGRQKMDDYQGAFEQYEADEAERAKALAELRLATSIEAVMKVVEQAGSQQIPVKIAVAEPGARNFAYGVARRLKRDPAFAGIVFLIRYSKQVAGTAQATAAKLGYLEDVMKHGVIGSAEAIAREVADKHKAKEKDAPVDVEVKVAQKAEAAQKPAGGPAGGGTSTSSVPLPLDVPTGSDAEKEPAGVKHEDLRTQIDKAIAEQVKRAAKRTKPEGEDDAEKPKGEIRVEYTAEDNEKIERIARTNANRFNEAWKTILAEANTATDEGFQNRFRALQLTELLLVSQNQSNPDKDHWLDLKLLMEMIQAGNIEQFLKKHSLTEYSDKLQDPGGMQKQFSRLEKHALGSLDAMRLIVSELHGTKEFLSKIEGSKARIAIFNGTARAFLDTIERQNLNAVIANGHYLQFARGGGKRPPRFFPPACVYFTTLSFETEAKNRATRIRKEELAAELAGLKLSKGDSDRLAMVLPPAVIDLGTLGGPTYPTGEEEDAELDYWYAADGEFQNALETVPLHFVGPSMWLRPPDEQNRFSTVIPAGYQFLVELLQCSISDVKIETPIPGMPFIFNLGQETTTLAKNLQCAFDIIEDRPSFAVTFNLYIALLDALIREWKEPVKRSLLELIDKEPPTNKLAEALWRNIAFETETAEALDDRRNRSDRYLSAKYKWERLWWHPLKQADNSLAPLKTIAVDENDEWEDETDTIPGKFVGWLNEILRRY